MTEPWCWPPDVVARLTERQIELIISRQAEKVRIDKTPGAPQPRPDRERLIDGLMSTFGKTREEAERHVDAAEPV